MADTPTNEKVQIEIPYGVVEYTAYFKKPIVEVWPAIAQIISVVLESLGPFGFKLDGVETKTHTEKLIDYAIVFRRSNPGVTMTLHLGRVVFNAENLDWTEANHFISLARSGINAIVEKTRAEIEGHHVAMALHVQLKNKSRQEVTAPLLSPQAFELMDGEVLFPGIILQREKASIVIDASAAFANGLFVRINRNHAADVTLERMGEILLADEMKVCSILNLEGTL